MGDSFPSEIESYCELIVSTTKCESLSLRIFINVRERFQSEKLLVTTLDEIIGSRMSDRRDDKPKYSKTKA